VRAIDLIGGTEIVGEADCWEALASQTVGRVAFIVDGQVEIFPINYSLDRESIVFATNPGRKMAGVLAADVAFEADFIDLDARAGWSVVVHGQAENVDRFVDESGSRPEPWAGAKEHMLRIVPRSITGRRVLPPSHYL
jgi:nitroimidazol reductase NimA-like FMN-containing flavoprotein (pyridoxamine 5'-phosphate oxidase superfamily)